MLTDELDREQQRPGSGWRGARLGARLDGALIGTTRYELADGQLTFPYRFHHGVEEWLYVLSGTPALRVPAGERVLAAGGLVPFRDGPARATRCADLAM